MEVNYLKIGDKVYSISEINAEGIDINAELKEFYEERHGQLAEEFGQVLNDGLQQEWDTQIAHLRKFDDKGNMTIPKNMFNKLLCVYHNTLMPCRVIMYSPNEVSASMSWVRSASQRITCIDFDNEVWDDFRDKDANVVITVKPKFAVPLVLAFDKKADRLYTPFMYTFHTMSGHNICTGNNKASVFWDLDDIAFASEMNRINTFSPAQDEVHINNVGPFNIYSYVSDDNIISVREREVTQWRA